MSETLQPVETFAEPYEQLIQETEAKFILEHAEKHLKEIGEAANAIATKTISLMTIVVGFIVALMGFVIGKLYAKDGGGQFDQLMFIATLTGAYLCIILYILTFNFDPTTYYTLGSPPKHFFDPTMINEENSTYRLVNFYVNEIEHYQMRIEENSRINDDRWKDFTLGLNMFRLLPAVIAVITALVFFLWK